ncbi:MAG: hypothetical protein QNK03_04270 [Myxococcota bacterium]|nr:hypothetical protein [Myxococcota bacterium]
MRCSLPLAASCAAALLASAPATAQVELEGTWYVLMHFQDSLTAKPEAWRWEDKVWKFEDQGDRLKWTEHPIVVFEDQTGRFEALGGNRASRVIAAWEPSEAQLADIRDGLQVNSRGTKSKTLKSRDGGQSFRSGGAGPAAASASIITYSETWTIEGMPDLPVFARDDYLGSARSESMEGRTEYRTEVVKEGGSLLEGAFARDDNRRGRFRLYRTGASERVRGSGLSQGQRAMRMLASQAGMQLDDEQVKALTAGRVAPGTEIPDDVREDVRAQIRKDVEQAFEQQGLRPSQYRNEVESLTRKIEKLILDEGKSTEEVRRMLQAGEITP